MTHTPNQAITRTLAVRAIALAIATAFAPTATQANPVGPTVVNGSASFATSGNTLAITNSPNAVLNWQQFNIGTGEVTKFIQQSSQSSVLNRITGQDPSQIFGQLQSNGKVLLLNPNGVLFGPTAKVDVQSLILSNLNLSNADFLAGKYNFSGTSTGSIKNQGSITTPMGGSVYLIGTDVSNSGIITSPQGEVVLAAGSSVTLGNLNTPELTVTLTADKQKATNLGTITAAGGKIDMYGALVENGGQLKANTVKVLGDTVVLTSTADIDVSGVGAGGTALIGGDWQGTNPQIKNATTTTVEQGTKINADAIDYGNGGKVVVWSNDKTFFDGFISAKGGANGGDGGKVETSGHTLTATGKVNTTAPYGKLGMWLLDPALGCISDGASCTVPGLSSPIPVTQSTANLDAALALSDVYMQVTDVAAYQTSKTFVVSAIPGLSASGRNLGLNAPYIYLGGSIDALTNSIPLRFDAFASGTSSSLPDKSGVVDVASGGNTFRSLESFSIHASKTVNLPNDVDFRVKYFNIYADDYLSFQPSGTVTWWQNSTNSAGYSSSFSAPYISLGGTATIKSNVAQAWSYVSFNANSNANAVSATYPSKSGMVELQPGTNWTFSLLGTSTTTYYDTSISLQAGKRLILGANSKISALRDSTSLANAYTQFSINLNAPIIENNGLTLIGDWTPTNYYGNRHLGIQANSLVGSLLTTQGFESVSLGPWYDYYTGGTAATLGDVLLGVTSCSAPDWCITDPRTWAVGDYANVDFNSNYYNNTSSTTGGNIRWLGPLTLSSTITYVSAYAQRSLTLDTPIDFGTTRGVSLGAGWGGDNANVPHDLVINQPIIASQVSLNVENYNNSTTVSTLKLNKPITASSYFSINGYGSTSSVGWAIDLNQSITSPENFYIYLNGKGSFTLNTPIDTKNFQLNQSTSSTSNGVLVNTAVINQPVTVNAPTTSNFQLAKFSNYGNTLTLNAPIKSSTSLEMWLYPACIDGSYTCANPTLASFTNKAGTAGLSAGLGWAIGQPYGNQTIDFGGMTASGPLSLTQAQAQTTVLKNYTAAPYTTGTYYVGNGTGVPPTAPLISLTTDSGISSTDKLTNNPALTVSTPTAGATRTYSVDNGTAGTTYVAPTTDGQHTVVVTDTNSTGQSANATLTFTLDKTGNPPTVALTTDTGTNTADKITSKADLTVSTLPSGTTRTYSIDGAAATSTYTSPSAAGQHTVVVTDVDVAGNAASTNFAFTLYSGITAPSVTLAADSGISSTDKLTNTATLNVSAAPSGVTRTYSVDGAAASSTYAPPTTDGSHTVVVTDTSVGGDTANASLTFTLDKTGNPPTVTLTTDTGTNTADKITSKADLTVSTLPSGTTRTYSIDGTAAISTYTPPSAAGQHTVVVTDVDAAGNAASTNFAFTLYSGITAPTVSLATDTGVSSTDKLTNSATLNVSSLPTGITRTYSVDGATASSTYTPPTTDGSHTVVVSDVNAVGDTANANLTFTLDKTGPAKPAIGLASTSGNNKVVVAANTFPNTPEVSKALSSLGIQIGQTIDIATATNGALSAESLTAPSGVTRTYFVDGATSSASYAAPVSAGYHVVGIADSDAAGNATASILVFQLLASTQVAQIVTETCATNTQLCTTVSSVTQTQDVTALTPATVVAQVTYDEKLKVVETTKAAEAKAAEQKAADDKKVAEVKAAEDKKVAETKAADDKKAAESKTAQADSKNTGSSKDSKPVPVAETGKAVLASAKAADAQKTSTELKTEAKQIATEAKAATVEAKAATVEAKAATVEAKAAKVEVKKAETVVKTAEAATAKADTAVKQAEADVKAAKTPEAKAQAETKKVQAEAQKSEAQAKRAEAEAVKPEAEAKAAVAEAKTVTAQAKEASAQAKQASAEAKQASAEAKDAKTPEAKVAAEQKADNKRVEAIVKKAEADVKQAKAETKHAEAEVHQAKAEAKKTEASAHQADAEVKLVQTDKAPAKRIEAEVKKAEVEVKKAEVEVKKVEVAVKKAEAEVKQAKTPEAKAQAESKHKVAESKKQEAETKLSEHKAEADTKKSELAKAGDRKQLTEAKQAEAQDKQKAADTKKQDAQTKEAKHEERTKAEKAETAKAFAKQVLANSSYDKLAQVAAVRHELKSEVLKPALTLLEQNPKAADLPACGGGADLCIPSKAAATTAVSESVGKQIAQQMANLPKPTVSALPQIERKIAVLVGINNYQDKLIPGLESALPDAEAIGKMLGEKLGYDVRVIKDGTRADIVKAINGVAGEVGPNDSVAVYYAGHGYMAESNGQKVGYWIPSDGTVTSPKQWISNSDISKLLANIPAKQVMLVSDSCYSGALVENAKISADVAKKAPQDLLKQRTVTVMSSGGEEPVSDEGKEGHSIFAWRLMESLKKVDAYQAGVNVFEGVRQSVMEEFPQVPQYGASAQAGHAAGGDYLIEARSYK